VCAGALGGCPSRGIEGAVARADFAGKKRQMNHFSLVLSDDTMQIGQRTAKPLHD
jgi:hypothetical protein